MNIFVGHKISTLMWERVRSIIICTREYKGKTEVWQKFNEKKLAPCMGHFLIFGDGRNFFYFKTSCFSLYNGTVIK